MKTYQPNGDGTCRRCGRDVGAHDGGHKFTLIKGQPYECAMCDGWPDNPIHDVGRTLLCPSATTNLDRVTVYPKGER
jgi:hypothetical protein